MRKTSISLQDLRRSLYVKAKAEPDWRFWGVYVHVCKLGTLREAYQMAKKNDGAPGIDGVTFEDIEESGVEEFLEQIKGELKSREYRPMRVRKVEIPKDGGRVRVLSIPAIRDRVVQGALKLTLEPIFEADFQPGSYGYRPKRTAHQAVQRVEEAIAREKTRVIDIDLRAYFDNVKASSGIGKDRSTDTRCGRDALAPDDSEGDRETGRSSGRRDHSPYTKGNFEFERVVTGWRGMYSVLDLRLKR
jgi:RNA-directed DNA polymerase